MEATTIPRALTIVALIAMILAFVPATTAGGDAGVEPQSHDPPPDCVLDRSQGSDNMWAWVDKRIVVPRYAAGELPLTTLSWVLLFSDSATTDDALLEERMNGFDAYIIDLGCEVSGNAFYCLFGDDSGVDAYDLQVTFRDSSFSNVGGPTNLADSPDVCDGKEYDDKDQVEAEDLTAKLPDQTRYVEIVTVDGSPGACGCLHPGTLLPASVETTFLLTT